MFFGFLIATTRRAATFRNLGGQSIDFSPNSDTSIVECLKIDRCAATLGYVKKLEGVNNDLELAGLLGIPLNKISAICRPSHFLCFLNEYYPYAYEAYLKAKFDETLV